MWKLWQQREAQLALDWHGDPAGRAPGVTPIRGPPSVTTSSINDSSSVLKSFPVEVDGGGGTDDGGGWTDGGGGWTGVVAPVVGSVTRGFT